MRDGWNESETLEMTGDRRKEEGMRGKYERWLE